MKFDSEFVEAAISWSEERAIGAEQAGHRCMAGAFEAFRLMLADAAHEDGVAFNNAQFGIVFEDADAE